MVITTEDNRREGTTPSVGPLLAALTGAALFLVTFVAAGAYRSNDGSSYSATEWLVTAGLVAFAVVGALFAARMAERRDTATVALVLGVVAALTFVGFWSGIMHVLATEAAFLALLARSSDGRWTARSIAALAVALATVVAGVVLVVVG